MSSQPSNPKDLWVAQQKQAGIAVLDEALQKVDDPVEELRKQQDKTAIVVPYEYLWPDQYKPLKNPEHKRFYDADLLTEHLEAAGYRGYVLRVLEFQGWSFLVCEAVRILNAKERRYQKRHGDLPMRDNEAVAGVVSGADRHDGGSVEAGDSQDGDEEATRSGN